MNIKWLDGYSDYRDTLAIQETLVAAHIADPSREDDLLLLEHSPVYTIGMTRDRSSLRDTAYLPHPVVEINRGGQATYHGPGQLVGYPIIDLNRRTRDIHRYVTTLEEALIAACEECGVRAHRHEGLTGVWVGTRKLASIGVGIRKWVTMHGIAINIEPQSLPPFQSITPCGIQGVGMTCLHDEGASCTLRRFGDAFAARLKTALDGM